MKQNGKGNASPHKIDLVYTLLAISHEGLPREVGG
jgi:hypothetical protein